jgi:magnesium chelatase family protein
MHVDVPRVELNKLDSDDLSEDSTSIRVRVERARKIQRTRFVDSGIINAEMNQRDLKKYCALDAQSRTLLRTAAEKLDLSARAYYRMIKLARTIADLNGCDHIATPHIAEALQYRPK